ncbi:protein disulfide-isomerase-like [Paramacrobiotus metropolitanus]|uniref:protein disulfide-isomerase-like n=1 Tax=Paramacrobiotus metropolitanus TaxID=2943436 RepID=UPI002445C06E|nr:protein disulfide-isomerase-like [Paramacrobiotus metropolitanus]
MAATLRFLVLLLLLSLSAFATTAEDHDDVTVESDLFPQRTGCSADALKDKTLGENPDLFEENSSNHPSSSETEDSTTSSKKPKSAARKEAEAYLAQEKRRAAVEKLLNELPEEKGVLVLNASNFDTAVATFPDLIVEFYAPWCGHCKKLAPLYAQAATKLRENAISTVLAKVDATADKELSKKHGIKAFPTIKYFHDGEFLAHYSGEQTSEALYDFGIRAVKPVVILNTMEEQRAVHDIPGWRAIGSFPSGNSTAFEKAARMVDGVYFGMAGAAALQDIDQTDDIVAVANGRKPPVMYSGDVYNSSQLAEFIREATIDPVSELKDTNVRTLLAGKIRKFFFFTGSPEDAAYKRLKRATKKLSPEFHGTLRFIFSETPKIRPLKRLFSESQKDVLVEFYSPHCGACQALEPIYNFLAEKFQNDESIIIAKLDVTENDLDNVEISNYPTIHLYRRGEKVPVVFREGQTFKKLADFVKTRGEKAKQGKHG